MDDPDVNTYASHKTVSQGLLNTSVIQSNIGLLVSLYANDKENAQFGTVLIVLIIISFVLQFVIFILLTVLLHVKQNHKIHRNITAVGMNSLVTALSASILVVNMAITVVASEIKKDFGT